MNRNDDGRHGPAAGELRFGLLIPQDAPLDELVERWRRAEALGFDAAYVADHSGDYRDLDGYWLDGWTVLTHVATRTERIRVGTLVSNPLLHHPAQLAKQAITVDLLSGGRLELGIGTGIAGFDHETVGQAYWSPRERVERYADYLAIVDGVLRSPGRTFRYEGTHLHSRETPVNPGPLQQPRPPITVGGQSPTVLRLAARYGDCWNTHGPFGRSLEEIATITTRQNRHLDELCRAEGRDPAALRRSLLLFAALDAWTADGHADAVFRRFLDAGIGEFVVFWPPPGRESELDDLAELMTGLRRTATALRAGPS
jgi:alkanesulfonate monooxygenase SsuD/methylene tetrahydromethanopterin reductase-like flavin-dependent oxidoreductase (luciferase family)